ncbi:MAG: TlpA family protein disulfide reductase [Deltaproteobacteria bacterium]|nr:TlpA family protein disulfide reductase [Deltaproteobacteria bacterium]
MDMPPANGYGHHIMQNSLSKAARPYLYIILIGLVMMLGAANALADSRLDALGARAPLFSLKTLDNATWNLESKKGMVVIVNFWASWCGPCNTEAPELQSAYARLDKKKVSFIAIAVDDTEKDARTFARAHNLTFPIAIDANGTVSDTYQVFGIPKTVIIGRDGRIKYTHMGVITPADISRELLKLL